MCDNPEIHPDLAPELRRHPVVSRLAEDAMYLGITAVALPIAYAATLADTATSSVSRIAHRVNRDHR